MSDKPESAEDLPPEEMQILRRLLETPVIEGAEALEIIGSFEPTKKALKHLAQQRLIRIKGSADDEKELVYSAIVSERREIKKLLG